MDQVAVRPHIYYYGVSVSRRDIRAGSWEQDDDVRGNFAKYAAKYPFRSGSFKSIVGMFGKGFLHTNSPLSPSGSGFPSGEKTATSIPNALTAISPGYEGSERVPCTKEPHNSVPPDMDTWQIGPKASASQLASVGVRTAPVEMIE